MIKNIIFDFGDIFINLDKEATFIELAKLGIDEISNKMIMILHHYEKGEISTNDFIDFFHDEFKISKEKLVFAWNAILLDFPKKTFGVFERSIKEQKIQIIFIK